MSTHGTSVLKLLFTKWDYCESKSTQSHYDSEDKDGMEDSKTCSTYGPVIAKTGRSDNDFSERVYVTAPLGCGLHMMPYHYYGGFTPCFYRKYFQEFGIRLISIEPNGGLLKHFLQESNRIGGELLGYKKY